MSRDQLRQPCHLSGRTHRHLSCVESRLRITEPLENGRLLRSEAAHRLVYLVQPDEVDDHVRRAVVRDDDHEHGGIANRHLNSKRHPAQDTRAEAAMLVSVPDEVRQADAPFVDSADAEQFFFESIKSGHRQRYSTRRVASRAPPLARDMTSAQPVFMTRDVQQAQ